MASRKGRGSIFLEVGNRAEGAGVGGGGAPPMKGDGGVVRRAQTGTNMPLPPANIKINSPCWHKSPCKMKKIQDCTKNRKREYISPPYEGTAAKNAKVP